MGRGELDDCPRLRWKALHTLSIVQDITARRLAEEALHKSELLNQAVLGSLGANIAVLDKNGDIIAVNTAWKRFAWENNGPALAETIGANYLDACRHSLEQGNGEVRRALDGIQEVLRGELQDFQINIPATRHAKNAGS